MTRTTPTAKATKVGQGQLRGREARSRPGTEMARRGMVLVGMVVNLDVEAIAYWMLCAYWMLIGACNPMGWPIHVYRHVTAMGMFELCGYRQARSNTPPPHTHTSSADLFLVFDPAILTLAPLALRARSFTKPPIQHLPEPATWHCLQPPPPQPTRSKEAKKHRNKEMKAHPTSQHVPLTAALPLRLRLPGFRSRPPRRRQRRAGQ